MRQHHFSQLILLLVAGGFLLMLIDVRHMHREILSEHWQSWIPIVISVLGFFIAVALIKIKRLKFLAILIYLSGIGAGLYGSYLHSEGEMNKYLDLFASKEIVAYALDKDEYENEKNENEKEEAPPLLAPLGLSGLCAFGLVGALSMSNVKEKA